MMCFDQYHMRDIGAVAAAAAAAAEAAGAALLPFLHTEK